jgi:hypothetical protein
VRMSSATAPIPVDGVSNGSNAGMCSRTVLHQLCGTGGFSQVAGSELPAVCVGDDQRARWPDHVEQRTRYGDRAAAHPAEARQRAVNEQ